MPSAERMIAVRPTRPAGRRKPARQLRALDRGARRRALRAPVSGAPVSRAGGAPRASRAEYGAALDADLDQDRRLPRGLRLLSAGQAPPHGRRGAGPGRPRRRPCRRPRGAGPGRHALLHGRRMARTEGARSCAGAGDGARSEGARARDVLHARDAEGRPGRRAQGRRARLLQPQSRHLGRVLRRGDHDARLPGPARHARPRPRRPASTSAAAASSGWASPRRSAPG